jgi:hypothetical protein
LSISPDEVFDFELVLFDKALYAFAARAGLRTRVRHGAAEAHIVADEFLS